MPISIQQDSAPRTGAAPLSDFIGDAEAKMVGLLGEAAKVRHASPYANEGLDRLTSSLDSLASEFRGAEEAAVRTAGISEGCSLDRRRAYLIWEAAYEAAEEQGTAAFLPRPKPLTVSARVPHRTAARTLAAR